MSLEPSRGMEPQQLYAACVCLTNDSGHIVAANEQFSTLFGYTADEVTTRSIATLIPEEWRETARGLLIRLRAGRAIRPGDRQMMQRNGRALQVYLSSVRRVEIGGNGFFILTLLHGESRERWIARGGSHGPQLLSGALVAFDAQGRTIFAEGAALEPLGLVESIDVETPAATRTLLDPHYRAALSGESRGIELMVGETAHQVRRSMRFIPLRAGSSVVGAAMLIEDMREPAAPLQSRPPAQAFRPQQAPAVLTAVLQTVSEAVLVVGADRKILYRNPAAERILGHATLPFADDPDATDLRTWLREDGMPLPQDQWPVTLCLATGTSVKNRTIGLVDGNGQCTWLTVSAQPLRGTEDEITGAVVSFAEITHFVDVEERVVRQALYDGLTGLPNRALFGDRIRATIGSSDGTGRTFAIALIDLDHFKQVNDSLGHAAGDRLLREVAARLKARVGEGDTLARMGGDEFALLLPAVGDAGIAQVTGNALLRSLQAPFFLGKREVFVAGSIGISLYPADGEDVETLLRRADSAMYRAKAAGRSNVQVFERAMDAAARERFELDGFLHHATARNELVLHYQPKVDLKTGELVGSEALLRWNHPQYGMLAPERFIPLAEENGLIIDMGEWALREACKQASLWAREGTGHKVSVNVSAVQFRRADFVEMVVRALTSASLDPSLLELELTESVVMRDIAGSSNQLARLRALGVRVSIDDFGTGYSSLGYLHKLPIDVLKIDKSFVQAIEKESNALSLVKAMTSLALTLGMSVVAEGIETQLQRTAMRDAGCRSGQGFLFARPLPADVFERVWLKPPDVPPLKQ